MQLERLHSLEKPEKISCFNEKNLLEKDERESAEGDESDNHRSELSSTDPIEEFLRDIEAENDNTDSVSDVIFMPHPYTASDKRQILVIPEEIEEERKSNMTTGAAF